MESQGMQQLASWNTGFFGFAICTIIPLPACPGLCLCWNGVGKGWEEDG
jgi:hypothetical protein